MNGKFLNTERRNMKTIKYKYHKTYGNPKEIREKKVFVDDLRMVKNNWGHILANIEYLGVVTLLEIDGVSVKKPWIRKHTMEEFDKLWYTDKNYRIKRPRKESLPVIYRGRDIINKEIQDETLRIQMRSMYVALVNRTDEYDDTYKYIEKVNELLKTETIYELIRKVDNGENI